MENKTYYSIISYNGTTYKNEGVLFEGFGLFYSYTKNLIVLSHTEHTDSLFNRLHFDNGNTTAYFDLFDYHKTLNNEDIYVWKIDWNGKEDEKDVR